MSCRRGEQFDRSAPVPGAADKAFVLKVRQVLMNGGQRGEAEASADFLEAWSVSVLLDELLEVVENFPLAFREWLHWLLPAVVRKSPATIHKEKAKIHGVIMSLGHPDRPCHTPRLDWGYDGEGHRKPHKSGEVGAVGRGGSRGTHD